MDWAIDLDSDENFQDDADTDGDDGNYTQACDYSLSFNTLADLATVSSQYSVYYIKEYAVKALSSELSAAMTDFAAANKGYDTLFGHYEAYIKDMIQPVLDSFLRDLDGPGLPYFKCTYNEGGHDISSRTCPYDAASLQSEHYTLYFDLTDANSFYDALGKLGILHDWVSFGDKDAGVDACHGSATHGTGSCVPFKRIWHGWPVKAATITFPNHKDIIAAAAPNMQSLQAYIAATWMNQMVGQLTGSGTDALQVIAMPVALIQQAVASMVQVKAIGKTEEQAK